MAVTLDEGITETEPSYDLPNVQGHIFLHTHIPVPICTARC